MQVLSALEHYESQHTKREDDEIKAINLNYRDIISIGYIPDRFRFVEELYLNHNSISQLNGIEQFPFLKALSIKFNLISSLDQFSLIINKKSLLLLNFTGNPVAKDPAACKDYFLQLFPNLLELNDSNIENGSLKYLETARSTARSTARQTPGQTARDTYRDSHRDTYRDSHRGDTYRSRVEPPNLPYAKPSSNQSLVIKNFAKVTQPQTSYTAHEEDYKDTGKSTVRNPPAKVINQENSYMLTDHDRYDNGVPFENQKTAKFAEVQAQKNAYVRQTLITEEGWEFPQITERYGDISKAPFIVDQSQINDVSSFQARSIDISMLKQMGPKMCSASRIMTTEMGPKQVDLSYTITRSRAFDPSRIDTAISNVFDKHILNIDKDIDELAKLFHEKSLKERALKGLKEYHRTPSEDNGDESISEENNQKAVQFRNNLRMIRVFYAWVFYMNTNRRKVALIQTIKPSRCSTAREILSERSTNSLSSRSYKEKPVLQKGGYTYTESPGSENKQCYNYYLEEDFV